MQRLSILHTNDIHGNVSSIARVAMLRRQLEQQHPTVPVVYVDAGDCLDKHAVLSKLSHGVAMYELLGLAGCQVSVLGNKCLKRWGMDIVAVYASHVPVLVANILQSTGAPLPGTFATIVLDVGSVRLGFLGVSAYDAKYIAHHQLQTKPLLSTTQHHIRELYEVHGVATVILLSHLGLYDDYSLARALRGQVELIIGAHSHTLLPHGVDVNGVSIAQAGSHGRFVGQIDVVVDDHLIVERMYVHPLHEDIPPDTRVSQRIDELQVLLKHHHAYKIDQ